MNFKIFLNILALIILGIFIYGVWGAYLISAQNTTLVILGFTLTIGYFVFLSWLFFRYTGIKNRETKSSQSTQKESAIDADYEIES